MFRRLINRRRFFRFFPPITIFLIIGIGAFGIGFLFFSEKVSRETLPKNLVVADGIIVLTGGTMRLETGFNLFNQHKAKRLLISGVNPETNRSTLIAATGGNVELFDCCVDLGRTATDTIGNARESAQWMKEHSFKSAYIVTNDYHIPRALLELRRFMPDVIMIPYPVNADMAKDQSWSKWSRKQRFVLGEYIKFIVTKALGVFS